MKVIPFRRNVIVQDEISSQLSSSNFTPLKFHNSETLPEDEFTLKMKLVRQSLEKLNKLMDDLKQANRQANFIE